MEAGPAGEIEIFCFKIFSLQDEGYHPHAASTYLTEHIGGIYSVEQGREIGFTSNNLPLAKANFSEDTESQYADELRRQAYIQTLGRFRLIFLAEQLITICLFY